MMISILFTKFHAKGVAKKYELANGKPVKTPADTFKTGSFETIIVGSMEELATFIEAREPGDRIIINQKRWFELLEAGFFSSRKGGVRHEL
jgi:hypothetical protein